MFSRLTAAAALVALSAGVASAQSTTTAPADKPAASGTASQAGKDMKEWQAAPLAKTSLAQAIATAEGKEAGGRAIDADFELADGKNPAHYSIKVVYPDGKLVEHGVNADTGELYKSENQPIERYFTRLKPADFNNAKTSLKDALAIAEQKAGGGKAYEAEVEREGNAVEYEISVALPDGSKEIKVGPDGVAKAD